MNSFPIMHLIGSTKGTNQQDFIDAEKYYTEKGYIVFKPVFFDLLACDPKLSMLTDMCTQKLKMCDVVCVVTEHIGDNTKFRIEQARKLNKKIIYYSPH